MTDANAYWEMGLGIDPAKILVLYNGLRQPAEPTPPPRTRTVVSVGRIDPLKDIHTLLRVAAETLRLVPDARFEHYGPVTEGEEAYGRSCLALHERLGLGDRFRFMGRTTDPNGAVRDADVVLMTSISEGLPMSILEAMGQGRPVVSTGVGGVPDVVTGCGVGDAARATTTRLAMAVVMLLRNPDLAWRLGQRGHRRLGRIFNESACIDGYRDLLHGVAAARAAARRRRRHERRDARAPRGRRSSRRGSAARRRTCSRRRSSSRRGPASRRRARSTPARASDARACRASPQPSVGRLPAPPRARRRRSCRGRRVRRHGDRDRGAGRRRWPSTLGAPGRRARR